MFKWIHNDSLLDVGGEDRTTIWWKNIPSSKLVKLSFTWIYNFYDIWEKTYHQYQQKKAQGIRTEQFAEEVRADLGTPPVSTRPRPTFDFPRVN